jgi:CRISPR-associated exonuclease Cas4
MRPASPSVPQTAPAIGPTAAEFSDAGERITLATRTIAWRRPSRDDIDRILIDAVSVDEPLEAGEPAPLTPVIAAGQLRGVVLHKLMEELLTGQVADDLATLSDRAKVLVEQVAIPGDALPEAVEMAQVAIDSFRHESLKPYIVNLVPEFPLYGTLSDTELIAARADAVAIESGRATFVVDWKSDVEPSPSQRVAYEDQLLHYLDLLDVESGAVVYMTKRQVQFIHRKRASTGA